MREAYILRGLRCRGDERARIEARLVERAGPDQWRAILRPAGQAREGDRLRFGESSESMACMLGFLDAEIVAISGEEAMLVFAFSDAALDEAIERLGQQSQF